MKIVHMKLGGKPSALHLDDSGKVVKTEPRKVSVWIGCNIAPDQLMPGNHPLVTDLGRGKIFVSQSPVIMVTESAS